MKSKVRRCDSCQHEVTAGLIYCPHCGSKIDHGRKRDSKVSRPSVFIQFLLIGIPCGLASLVSIVLLTTPSLRMSFADALVGVEIFGLFAFPVFAFLSWEMYREMKGRL